MDAPLLPRTISVCRDREAAVLYPACLCRRNACWPWWNPLTHASFLEWTRSPEPHTGLVGHGLTCLPSHFFVPQQPLRRAIPFAQVGDYSFAGQQYTGW